MQEVIKPEPIELKRIAWEMFPSDMFHQENYPTLCKLYPVAICQTLFDRYDLKWHEIAFAMSLRSQVEVLRLKEQHRKLIRTDELYQMIYNNLK